MITQGGPSSAAWRAPPGGRLSELNLEVCVGFDEKAFWKGGKQRQDGVEGKGTCPSGEGFGQGQKELETGSSWPLLLHTHGETGASEDVPRNPASVPAQPCL